MPKPRHDQLVTGPALQLVLITKALKVGDWVRVGDTLQTRNHVGDIEQITGFPFWHLGNSAWVAIPLRDEEDDREGWLQYDADAGEIDGWYPGGADGA